MNIKIIYEDAHLLVIHKPAGLATQTSHIGQQDVVSELKNYLKKPYLGIIHRLDQPVEGLLVFAKTKDVAAKLTKQLAGGVLNKQYYALICGKSAQKEGKLVNYLIKEGNIGRIGMPEEKDAKPAILQYQIIKEWNEGYSLADIHIETGRFHQIRLQMSHAGHPILGDTKYGSAYCQEISRKLGVNNVALYAYRLDFKHPVTSKALKFEIKPKFAIDIQE